LDRDEVVREEKTEHAFLCVVSRKTGHVVLSTDRSTRLFDEHGSRDIGPLHRQYENNILLNGEDGSVAWTRP